MSNRIALIDGDVIAFKVAFEKKQDEESIEKYGDQTLRTFEDVKRELHYFLGSIITNVGTSHYIGFLTGKGNFRKELVPKIYKANRKGVEYPKFLFPLKKYMIEELGFINCEGIEADDALSICQRNLDNTIICGNDKDFKQIPGDHYNINKKEEFNVKSSDAELFLWSQMLIGDVGDNVIAIRGIGPKKAEKILEEIISSKKGIVESILSKYINSFGIYEGICKFAYNYQCLKLLEEPNEYFSIPEPISVVKLFSSSEKVNEYGEESKE